MNKINVTDARKDMSSFFDSAIFEKPVVLKRRKYEAVMVEHSLMKEMLKDALIHVNCIENDKKWIYRATELDIFGEGESKIDAENALAEAVIQYANEVYDNFMYYYYGQHIKEKLPIVFHVLLCDELDEVKALFVYQAKKKTAKPTK